MQGSQGTVYAYKTITSVNLTNTIIYSWMNAGSVDTKANGGFRIIVGDGTNIRAYYVGGSDDYGFQLGAWSCFILDTSNPPTSYAQIAGSSAPNFAAITNVGCQFNVPIKAVGSGDNVFLDVCRYISNSSAALTIGGGGVGTEGTFSEIAADDASTSAGKAYGIIREIQTGVFGIQGSIEFGDSGTSSSYFKDTDAVIVFEDRSVPDSYYVFSTVGNSTGTNSFILGNKVGSGDTAVGSNGCTIQSAGPGLKIDFSGANFDEIKIYGSKILKASNGVLLNDDTTHEFIGNTVDQSGQIDPKQTIIRSCTFSGTTDNNNDGSALLWNANINIKNCSFNANTDTTNDPHGIEHPNAGTFTYDNLTFSGNDYDIENSSTGSVTINATNGANPGTYENTNGGSTTINNSVTIKVTVKDDNGSPIQDAQTAIYKSSDNTELMNKDTDANGIASTTFNYLSDTDVYIRVRKSSAGDTKYQSHSSTGTITSSGLNVTVTLKEDPYA
ncbi:MAG: hypothetical protein DRP09_14810 [Candidatus Thorarchaeota archaeon]|nr:MAG: hypothetical protein DRP09_14810 [Candidatus Thorarchaeota archaeon]